MVQYIPQNYPGFDVAILPNTFRNRWNLHTGFWDGHWYVQTNNANMFPISDSDNQGLRQWELGEQYYIMLHDLLGIPPTVYAPWELSRARQQQVIREMHRITKKVSGPPATAIKLLASSTLRDLQEVLKPIFKTTPPQIKQAIVDASQSYPHLMEQLETPPMYRIGEPQQKRRQQPYIISRLPVLNAEDVPLGVLFDMLYTN